MELFGLWEPQGLGALQTSISLRGCDSHRPGKEEHRMTRQGDINPIMPQLSPSSSCQETVPKMKGVWQREGLDIVRDSLEGLEHRHASQQPVLRGGSGVKFLVWGIWRVHDNHRWICQKIGSHQLSVFEKVGPVLVHMQLCLSQALFPQTWIWAGFAVACGNQCWESQDYSTDRA